MGGTDIVTAASSDMSANLNALHNLEPEGKLFMPGISPWPLESPLGSSWTGSSASLAASTMKEHIMLGTGSARGLTAIKTVL